MNERVSRRIKNTVYIATFAAIISVCSLISVPFAVPLTMQTFAVFFTLLMLGGKRGSCAVAVYMLLGIAGLPVFSGFMGGFSALFGATGGYVIGFLLAALVYWLIERLLGDGTAVTVLSCAAGLLICYLTGTLWYAFVFMKDTGSAGLYAAFLQCVLPFVVPDIIKIALAFLLRGRLKRFIL